MYCKKLLYLKPEEKIALEDVKTKIKQKGGNVSVMRLIQDSIKIFLDHYTDDAIQKYSSNYQKNS